VVVDGGSGLPQTTARNSLPWSFFLQINGLKSVEKLYIHAMIMLCPHCGHSLHHVVIHGITSCSNCNRVFDTSPFNCLLSASWLVRRKNIAAEESLMQYGYTMDEAKLVLEAVYDNCFTHEDFVKLLNELKISKVYQASIDVAS
jgi:ribosomal protein L37AE/L43A